MSNRTVDNVCAPAVATPKRRNLLKVRVTFGELDQIDLAASARQMDRSSWVRHACKMQSAREAIYRHPPLQLDPRDVAAARQARFKDAMEG